MFQHIISTESTCESKLILDSHVKQKNSPILKQSVSIKMLIQPYHSLISNSTAWCSTPTLLLICSQFVGKMIIHCWFAHHDTHSPVKLSSFRTTQNSIGKEETCTCDIGDPPISARSKWYLFVGGLCDKKMRGMLPFFETNDSINDVQSGLSRWHNFQTNGLVNS